MEVGTVEGTEDDEQSGNVVAQLVGIALKNFAEIAVATTGKILGIPVGKVAELSAGNFALAVEMTAAVCERSVEVVGS